MSSTTKTPPALCHPITSPPPITTLYSCCLSSNCSPTDSQCNHFPTPFFRLTYCEIHLCLLQLHPFILYHVTHLPLNQLDSPLNSSALSSFCSHQEVFCVFCEYFLVAELSRSCSAMRVPFSWTQIKANKESVCVCFMCM